jgi:Asp-tRNA(Asn)/Glu-tRNA(Gln) amidotransferase A subunit family amidase
MHQMRRGNFNFLSVLGLEELNHSISDRTILDVGVGVQVVAPRFQEETILKVMKELDTGLNRATNLLLSGVD